MKNLLKVGVLALVLVLVSGCGSKEKVLTCTISEDLDSMKMASSAKINFNNDEATKINMSIAMTVDESYKDYMSMLEESLKSEYSKLENEKGVSYNTSVKDTTVTITIDANLKEMSDDAKEKLDLDGATGTYDDAKKSLEEQGFTCK